METTTNLEDFLSAPETYNVLDLSNQNITPAEFIRLFTALKDTNNSTLTSLNCSGNKLSSAAIMILADWLGGQNTALNSLNMSRCYLGSKAITTVVNALEGGGSVKELILCTNAIGDETASLITETLTRCESLTVLDLEGNQISEQGSAALCGKLAKLGDNLKILNQLGEQGVIDIFPVQVEAAEIKGAEVDVLAKMAEVYEGVQGNSELCLVVIGNTGAGKSTFVNYLAGNRLQVTQDPESKKLLVDRHPEDTPLAGITINHTSASGTKIPYQCSVNIDEGEAEPINITIWDCPGNNPSSDANIEGTISGFTFDRLFEATKQVKLLLVVPEFDITHGRGNGFVNAIARLTEEFSPRVLDAVSLVVTRVTEQRNEANIKYLVREVFNENDTLRGFADDHPIKGVIKSLLQDSSTIHIFPKFAEPAEEIQPDMELIASIHASGDYLHEPNAQDVRVSEGVKGYSENILRELVYNNLNMMLHVISQALVNPTDCRSSDPEKNAFLRNYESIKPLVPESYKHFAPMLPLEENQFLTPNPDHPGAAEERHFTDLDQLSELKDILWQFKNGDFLSLREGMNAIASVLSSFEKSIDVANRDTKDVLLQYAYALHQQLNCLEFISGMGAEPFLAAEPLALQQYMTQCYNGICRNLEAGVRALEIEPDGGSQAYYDQAISYLTKYSDCEPVIAQAYMFKAQLEESENANVAVGYYAQAIDIDAAPADACEKLGDLLFKSGDLPNAVKAYSALHYVSKIDLCFATLQAQPTSTENAALMLSIANYRSQWKEGEIVYLNTLNANHSSEFFAQVKGAVTLHMRDSHLCEVLNSGKFYNFAEVNEEFRASLLLAYPDEVAPEPGVEAFLVPVELEDVPGIIGAPAAGEEEVA
ncbi:MAG: hypothetical protein COA94_00160 [Rickettsiales bacterium]|nr:MAG: hypothetical protein COA94_00160 [Rickettsiales bacterium]